MEKKYSIEQQDEIKKIKEFTRLLDETKTQELNRQQLESIKYYREFSFESFKLEDVYIVVSVNEKNQKVYDVYLESANNKVMRINTGTDELVIDENVKPLFTIHDLCKEEIEEFILNNKENLRVQTETVTQKEIKEELEKADKEKKIEDMNEKENNEKIKTNKKVNQNDRINNDLKIKNNNKDFNISYYKKITDSRMVQEFPEFANGAKEIGIAYSESLNGFVCIVEKDDGFEIAEGTEVSKPLMYNVISIDEKGDNITDRIPHAMIKTRNKEIAINFDQYGYLGFEKVERTNENYRVGRKLDAQGQSQWVDENTKNILEKGGLQKINDVGKNYEKQKSMGDKEIEIEELTGEGDVVINTSNGNDINIAEEAKKAKVSEKEFMEYFENAEGNTPEEKLENAHEDLEEDYRNPSRRSR